MNQQEITDHNRIAWESQSYQAWVAAYGTPEEAAKVLASDPTRKLSRILPYLGSPDGLNIANPLGSHGRVAVSLALLGACVTVFDLSSTNRRYAVELAAASGVSLTYMVGDFLQLAQPHNGQFDCVVMELGVLHYFSDLDVFVNAVRTLLKSNGVVILNEFHPLLKKVIEPSKDGIGLDADYFSTELENAATPYEIFLTNEKIPTCLVRRWNLGEIVTAFAENGFRLSKLVEEPSTKITHLPGTFTLVANAMENIR